MENSRCSYPKKTHHFARFSIHPQCFSQPLQVAWPGRCIHNLYRPDSAIVPALHGPWVSRMANSTTICRIGDVIYDICIFIYICVCVCVIYAVSWDLVASPIWHLGGKPRRSRRPHMGERCTAEEPQNRRFFTHGVAVEVTNGYKYVCITVYIYIYII